MYRSLLFVLVGLVAVLVVGCAAPAAGSEDTATAAPGGVETPMVSPLSETPSTGGSGAIAPELADQAAGWLATESGVAATGVSLVKAERTEWTDSCFGLGGPAESCLAAMTPGWQIVFESGGQQYEVRTDEAGSNFRLVPENS